MDGVQLLVGRYELRGVLGQGGMAEVREGWDTRLDREVAIKLLHPALSAQPEIRRRFEAEARAAASLNHPNIVAVHDCGELDGTPFIVMERLPGGTLADEIAQGPVHPIRVRVAMAQILGALATAHSHGVLHRDIKPGNILLNTTGEVFKVADFGIAKTGGAAHTMTGQIVGTIAYLSPERLTGAPASVADDLYAVGIVGYEALTGRHPFPYDDIGPLARAILQDTPPPLDAVLPGIDHALVAVIERALSRDPGVRFRSADDMRAALLGHVPSGVAPVSVPARPATRVLDRPPMSDTYFPPPTVPTVRPRRSLSKRTRRVLAAAGVLVALTVTALAFALDSPSTQTTPETVSTSTPVPAPIANPPPPPPPPPPSTAAPVVQEPVTADAPSAGNEKKKGGGNGGRKGPKK